MSFYTLPIIVDYPPAPDPHPKIMSDSAAIADYLEAPCPEHPVYPEGGRIPFKMHLDAICDNVTRNMIPMNVPNTANIVEPKDREYFLRIREEIIGTLWFHLTHQQQFLGTKIDKTFSPHNEDAVWAKLKSGIDALSDLADSNSYKNGRWVFGTASGPTYADFVLRTMLVWLKRAGPQDGWERVKAWNRGSWEMLYEQCKEYLKRCVNSSSTTQA